MARIPDKIRSIDGSKETLKLAVRITDLWFVGIPNKSEQAEMVFVDFEVMDVMLFLCCSGEILSCTLWENYCTQFLSYLNERGDDGLMVIILTHARIKDAQGSYPASVSNSFKVSKLLINDPILEIQEFKERLLDLGVEVSRVLLPGDQASSQVSGGSQLSSKDSFLSKAEAKTILEINVISEVDLLSVFILYSLQLEVEFG
ncbi:hypothetical protein JHK87_031561 [Glycine soja]|nr:hypothetical protein JHK87_031561 [Glycine soja]